MRIPLLGGLFGRRPTRDESRQAARDRLKSALVGDRCSVAPGFNEAMRKDILEVLSRYMEVDSETLELKLEAQGEGMQWGSQVKVRQVHRQARLSEEVLKERKQTVRRSRRTLRGLRWRRSQEDELTAVAEEKSA